MKYLLDMSKNEILSATATYVELHIIMLSKISQGKIYMISLICVILKN